MSKHEQYEELCTLAMIGEVSAAEMQDLRQHLSACGDCREQYREFTQFLLPQLFISSDNDASFETGYSAAERKQLRREFLAGAQKKGHVFSQEAVRGVAHMEAPAATRTVAPRPPRPFYRWAFAAPVALLLFACGYATHFVLVDRELASLRGAARANVSPAPRPSDPGATAESDSLARLRETNQADAKAIASLETKLSETIAELEQAQRSLKVDEAGQSVLRDQLIAKNVQLASLQSQAQGGEQGMADLRTQVAQLQQRITDGQAVLAVRELRIRDLNEQLGSETASVDRERQMLTAGRDVRDLMGARNLHIIDVHDANGAGKDKKSFGRIFYTEGKSLIFYAFDLDDKRIMNANYSFEAWGERLGQPASVKSLGVLYVDDKAQRRWSLKVDDPHQLSEINSVFVTVEPHAGDRDKPEGKRILFAFLGGEANHP